MNVFSENCCRVCSQCFCCESCRHQHERNKHRIDPECDICLYGKTFLRRPTSSLLMHLRETHWPLHCLYCNTLFSTTEDLRLHNTCSVGRSYFNNENSNMFVTATSSMDSHYESPPITATMHKSILISSNKQLTAHSNIILMTTSTPMQKSSEQELLQNISEAITPVDYPEKKEKSDNLKLVNNTAISSITPVPTEQSKTTEPLLKRKVTFHETPITIDPSHHSVKHRNTPRKMCSALKKKQFSTTMNVLAPDTRIVNSNMMEYAINDSSHDTKNEGADKSCMYSSSLENTQSDGIHNFTAVYDCNSVTESVGCTSNDTLWETALIESESSPIKNPTSQQLEINQILTESKNISSVLHHNESNHNISIIGSTLHPGLNLFTNSETSSTADNINSTKLNFSSAITSKVEVLSPVINTNLTETNIPTANLTESKIISFVIDTNVTNSEILCNSNKVNYNIPDQEAKFSSTAEQVYVMNIESKCASTSQKPGIWSSVTNIFKAMVQNLSVSSLVINNSVEEENRVPTDSNKRPKPECYGSSGESPMRKKIKLTHLECRKTIRTLRPFHELKYGRMVVKMDKWTQTENFNK